ncbi:MAG TPA: ABC transporter substrate binding protein [Stellaceae bacterium]|nr:ABC transporter substrate binding protein [Stellaceae bacterium]
MSTAERDPHELSSVAAFVEGLAKRGWVEGRNLEVLVRWGAADPARIAANSREIVALAPDAILAKGATIPSARDATRTIPIVFVVTSDDAVQAWVRRFARPVGNLTGFSSPEQQLVGKRLQLLREAAPGVKRGLYLWNRRLGVENGRATLSRIVADAAAAGFTLAAAAVDSDAEIGGAIEGFAREPDGGHIVAFNAFTTTRRSA